MAVKVASLMYFAWIMLARLSLEREPERPIRRTGRNCQRVRVSMADAKSEISSIAPLFIVRNVPAALSFYRDRLGFDITFQGPDPDDIFFGIVRRGAATIMLKHVGVDPAPN